MATAIIIPTRDRAEPLAITLAALHADSSATGAEVIICENAASDPQTTAAASAYGARIVREPVPGLSRARNAGAAATKADLLVFLDDDLSVQQGWAAEMIRPIERNEADATVCRIKLASGIDTHGIAPAALAMLMTDDSIGSASPFLACSFAIRRSAFDDAGGFDVDLGMGSGVIPGHEDLLLTLQLQRAQRKIAFVATTTVKHRISPDKLTPEALMRRLLAGAQSDGWMAYHWFGRDDKCAAFKGHLARVAARLARLTPWTCGYASVEGRLRASASFHSQFALETLGPRRYHH